MTVKFEFTISDMDAENILGILQDAATNARYKAQLFISKNMTETDQSCVDCFNNHADYLVKLRTEMAAGSTRV